MKKIMKGAVVLLIAFAMFFSTVIVSADINQEKKELQIDSICPEKIDTISSNIIIKSAQGSVIFQQLPSDPNDSWHVYPSASNVNYLIAENFWDLTESICDIHWWGFSAFWDYVWIPCDPSGMQFEIIFYDTNLNPVCVYSPVIVTPVSTGIFYNSWELFYWETDLDPCCYISNGWVSIQSISSPSDCSFLWITSETGDDLAYQNWINYNWNLAFELTAFLGLPPSAPYITGPTQGNPNEPQEFKFQASDPDSTNLRYHIDWDDGTPIETTGYFPVGNQIDVIHTYTNSGKYTITAYAEDEDDNAGPPSTFLFTCPRDKTVDKPLLQFSQYHPYLFPLLQKLIQQQWLGL